MADNLQFCLTLAFSGLATVAMLTAAGLSGWRGWLDLKRRELDSRIGPGESTAINRIELASLRERIRKLEAIASGVDL